MVKEQNEKSRVAMGILAVLLWAIVLTMLLVSALDQLELAPILLAGALGVCGALLAWTLFLLARARRFSNRLNNAMWEFLIKRDVETYFSELGALERFYGNRPVGRLQGKEYFAYQRIFALKLAGRKQEAYALLEAALREAKSDRAILLFMAEQAHWD